MYYLKDTFYRPRAASYERLQPYRLPTLKPTSFNPKSTWEFPKDQGPLIWPQIYWALWVVGVREAQTEQQAPTTQTPMKGSVLGVLVKRPLQISYFLLGHPTSALTIRLVATMYAHLYPARKQDTITAVLILFDWACFW